MKASLPFNYITAVKCGKIYVVFDYKDNNGKRQRKWIGTGLPEKCSKKALKERVDAIVPQFYETFMNERLSSEAEYEDPEDEFEEDEDEYVPPVPTQKPVTQEEISKLFGEQMGQMFPQFLEYMMKAKLSAENAAVSAAKTVAEQKADSEDEPKVQPKPQMKRASQSKPPDAQPKPRLKASQPSMPARKSVSELTKKEYGFTEFMQTWLETTRHTIADTSYQGYLWKVNTIVAYFDEKYPGIKLRQVTGMILQNFYNDMIADGKSANTVKHYHANIHRALEYAIKMDLIKVNESEKTERPRLDKFEATFYNANELEVLFNTFRGDRMELVVLIAAYYGLRRSEIIGLKWSSVDFENKTLTVHEQAYNCKENGKNVVKFRNQLKTKSSYRTLPLIPKIEELLLEKKKNDKYLAELLKSGYCHDYDEYICTDNFGNLITPDYVSDHFRQMIKKYKLKKLRFHDLRHSCASLLVANGVPMKAIQDWLGHSTFQVTADYYSHLDYNSKIDSANTIANILGGSEIPTDDEEEKNTKKNKRRRKTGGEE